MIAHIAKRFALIALGYVTATVVSALPVWQVTLVTGPTSYYWTERGELVGPEYTALMLTITGMFFFSLVPTLILISTAEIFSWRRLWVYLVGWVLIFAALTLSDLLPLSPAAKMTANLSALLGGFIYWVIAGRHAGRPIEVVSP
ncbi:hypothetical protein [Taklimakanibacter albus]|uniref:Uncharacterized protein n=1 Tax=Taklimakanibacter albus TaxID=2800327 RepID=A0ACC5QX22_9HYPH|nr:hypothetical protein [Aestuariivirga sp. YIM B02566]MBK1864919.1 hypothetical protein [Aestuariivirga sp. YIM B02566]